MEKSTKKPEAHTESVEPMDAKPKSKKGSVIAIVVIVVLALAAIGGTWWYMNKKLNEQKTQQQQQIDQLNKQIQDLQKQTQGQSTTSAQSQKTITTQYEKLVILYPSNLTLQDTSQAVNQNGISGTDKIKLTSSNGFKIEILTGVYGVGGACPECKVLKSEPITVLGQNVYLNYVSMDGGPKVDYVVVGKTSQDTFGLAIQGKNITVNNGDKTSIYFGGSYPNGDKYIAKTTSELTNDPNVENFKQILQGLKY